MSLILNRMHQSPNYGFVAFETYDPALYAAVNCGFESSQEDAGQVAECLSILHNSKTFLEFLKKIDPRLNPPILRKERASKKRVMIFLWFTKVGTKEKSFFRSISLTRKHIVDFNNLKGDRVVYEFFSELYL